EFAPPAMLTGGFLPHKVCDLLRVQRWPIHKAGGKTGREKTPSHPQIVITGARGNSTDLIQVRLIAQQPLIGLGTRRGIAAFSQAVLLTPELKQMGQSLSPFGQSARRRPLQSTDITSDERGIDISNGVTLLGQPLTEPIAASQITADTLPSVPLLVEGGCQLIKVGTRRPASQSSDRREWRKIGLDHQLLLLLESR